MDDITWNVSELLNYVNIYYIIEVKNGIFIVCSVWFAYFFYCHFGYSIFFKILIFIHLRLMYFKITILNVKSLF